MTTQQYGAAIEEALHQNQGALKEHNVPMPQFYLMLNITVSWFPAICFYPKPINSNQMTCIAKWSQPATYRIPRKYKSDCPYSTMLHENEKKLAIVEIARKYDFVKSIMDSFSIELTFLGPKSDDVHRDAG
jgi:hypothetical protein